VDFSFLAQARKWLLVTVVMASLCQVRASALSHAQIPHWRAAHHWLCEASVLRVRPLLAFRVLESVVIHFGANFVELFVADGDLAVAGFENPEF
jgi:hypothetical protein